MTPRQVFHRVILFSLPLLLHHCSTVIFVHALLLTERQTDEAWKHSIKQCSFGKRKALVERYFHFFVSLIRLTTLCTKRYCQMFIMTVFLRIIIAGFDSFENCKSTITQYNAFFFVEFPLEQIPTTLKL